jgi:hypothetical protein
MPAEYGLRVVPRADLSTSQYVRVLWGTSHEVSAEVGTVPNNFKVWECPKPSSSMLLPRNNPWWHGETRILRHKQNALNTTLDRCFQISLLAPIPKTSY